MKLILRVDVCIFTVVQRVEDMSLSYNLKPTAVSNKINSYKKITEFSIRPPTCPEFLRK